MYVRVWHTHTHSWKSSNWSMLTFYWEVKRFHFWDDTVPTLHASFFSPFPRQVLTEEEIYNVAHFSGSEATAGRRRLRPKFDSLQARLSPNPGRHWCKCSIEQLWSRGICDDAVEPFFVVQNCSFIMYIRIFTLKKRAHTNSRTCTRRFVYENVFPDCIRVAGWKYSVLEVHCGVFVFGWKRRKQRRERSCAGVIDLCLFAFLYSRPFWNWKLKSMTLSVYNFYISQTSTSNRSM